jgi:hypothetical protein
VDLPTFERETALEAGFVLVTIGFVAGLGLLVGGRVLGGAQRHRRHAEQPPSPGSIPAERHQQSSPSAR